MNNIKSIQLWRHMKVLGGCHQIDVIHIYHVEYDASLGIKKSNKIAFSEKVATFHLKPEPWILDTVRQLCSVRNYHKVVFGEGAKSSHQDIPASLSGSDIMKGNLWYCEKNYSKLCAEGAVANMLFHMNLREDAMEFCRLATITSIDELLAAMNASSIPKKVIDIRHIIDPIEKCIWILEKKFNCRRLGRLNCQQFTSSEQIVD